MKIENRSAYRRDFFLWCIVVEGGGLQNKGRINRALTECHKEKNEQESPIGPIMDGDFNHYIKQAIPCDTKAVQLTPQKEGHNKEEIFHER